MCTLNTKLLSVLVFTASSLISTHVSAAIEPLGCIGGDNIICIIESQSPNEIFNQLGTEYTVTNNSSERIYAFGVTTDNIGPVLPVHTSSDAWDAGSYLTDNSRTIHKSSWNNHEGRFDFLEGGEDGEVFQLFVSGERPVGDTSEDIFLGTFEELFGVKEEHVAFYWNFDIAIDPLNPGDTLGGFHAMVAPNTEFSSFSLSGTVVASSVAAVPEPETYAMFLAGLGLLGFAQRRQKASSSLS